MTRLLCPILLLCFLMGINAKIFSSSGECTTSGGRWSCIGAGCTCVLENPRHRLVTLQKPDIMDRPRRIVQQMWMPFPDDRQGFVSWLSEYSERK
ncbi:unnamed protein product, partial [Mesorhabditis spiculigera]